VIEKRRFARAPIDTPVTFSVKGTPAGDGIGKDISIGGMFVETATTAAFGAEVIIHMRLTTAKGPQDFNLPGVVRWVRTGGMGVQFRSLGALETNAITELGKS